MGGGMPEEQLQVCPFGEISLDADSLVTYQDRGSSV
jgi:hypothetical protein